MSEKQYAYRYYDTGPVYPAPMRRDRVLKMLHNDLSTLPLERTQLPDGSWSEWVHSDELLQIFLATPPQPACPPVEQGDSAQVSGSCKSSTPPQEAE